MLTGLVEKAHVNTVFFWYFWIVSGQQTRVYPYPLGTGSARPNPKMGAPDPENPLFFGFLCSEGE